MAVFRLLAAFGILGGLTSAYLDVGRPSPLSAYVPPRIQRQSHLKRVPIESLVPGGRGNDSIARATITPAPAASTATVEQYSPFGGYPVGGQQPLIRYAINSTSTTSCTVCGPRPSVYGNATTPPVYCTPLSYDGVFRSTISGLTKDSASICYTCCSSTTYSGIMTSFTPTPTCCPGICFPMSINSSYSGVFRPTTTANATLSSASAPYGNTTSSSGINSSTISTSFMSGGTGPIVSATITKSANSSSIVGTGTAAYPAGRINSTSTSIIIIALSTRTATSMLSGGFSNSQNSTGGPRGSGLSTVFNSSATATATATPTSLYGNATGAAKATAQYRFTSTIYATLIIDSCPLNASMPTAMTDTMTMAVNVSRWADPCPVCPHDVAICCRVPCGYDGRCPPLAVMNSGWTFDKAYRRVID